MDLTTIEGLVSQWETNTLECKETTSQLKAIGMTLCAFLNHQGGIVLIGIQEKDKRLVGQMVSDKTQQDIAHMLNEITPSAPIIWDMVDLPGTSKKIIVLKTQMPIPPAVYHFYGKAYERVGSTTRQMKYERLKQLMLEHTAERAWDQLPATGYTIEDLDEKEIYRTVEEGIECGRVNRILGSRTDLRSILMGIGVFEQDHLTNAAVVLFAKKMSASYLQCEIKMARFMGTTKIEGFIDEKRYIGHAFGLLEESEAFVRRHLNIKMEFGSKSFKRHDIPQIPFLAVREALINAICHRDYMRHIGCISLSIYDDRLEIWNFGGLPEPLNIEDLKKTPHESITRNKLIAHVFYLRKFIEKWGSGTTKIIELCHLANIPEPQYFEHTGGLCVCFKFKTEIKQSNHLSARQEQIIQVLFSRPKGLPVSEILNLLGGTVSLATLKRDLDHMKKMNHILSSGRGRSILWMLSIK